MNDIWTNRLSEYLDGELNNDDRVALEEHLATCGRCYATLGELRQVIARAQALQDAPPMKDLWAGIRAGMTQETPAVTAHRSIRPSARRFAFSIPQLLAASIALIAMSGGTAWLALHSGATQTPAPVALQSQPAPDDWSPRPAGGWRVRSDAAIAELQETLNQNEAKLDTSTVRVVRENLAIIDRAIAQAQKALRRDPGNIDLNLHLAKTMRQKIDLLRRANALVARES